MMLDKLPAIRGDPDWENWGYDNLAEKLRQWTRRNPIDNKVTDEPEYKRSKRPSKFYHARQSKGYVYRDDVNRGVYESDVGEQAKTDPSQTSSVL